MPQAAVFETESNLRTVILRMFDPRRMSVVAIALLTMVSLTMPMGAGMTVLGARLVVLARVS